MIKVTRNAEWFSVPIPIIVITLLKSNINNELFSIGPNPVFSTYSTKTCFCVLKASHTVGILMKFEIFFWIFNLSMKRLKMRLYHMVIVTLFSVIVVLGFLLLLALQSQDIEQILASWDHTAQRVWYCEKASQWFIKF